MCKKNIYNQILEAVILESEIDGEVILNPKIKTREVVDARCLLVYFLHLSGFDTSYIAKALPMTPQGVRQIISGFDDRRKQSGKIFEIIYKRIESAIEIN